jgi:hypothetical protein
VGVFRDVTHPAASRPLDVDIGGQGQTILSNWPAAVTYTPSARRKQVMKSSHAIIAAAVSGMFMGVAGCASSPPPAAEAAPTAPAADADGGMTAPKHACKGQNACKGQGGCKTDTHGCQGKNDCKGQGGCKGWAY